MNLSAHINNEHTFYKVRPKELLNIGLDPAVLWNVDRDREIDSSIFIVATLINGYSKEIIFKLLEFFGKDMIVHSLNKYRDRVSDELYNNVMYSIKQHQFVV